MFDEEEYPSAGYWPSVSDLFITLFIIAIALLAPIFFVLMPKNNISSQKAVIQAVGMDLRHIREPTNRLRTAIDLPQIREQQSPGAVIIAVEETCDKAIEYINELEFRINQLKELDSARKELARLQEENKALKRQLAQVRAELEKLRSAIRLTEGRSIEKLVDEIEDLKRQLNDKPPIIRIDEQRKEYRFESGSSIIGEDFSNGLNTSEFPRLAKEIIDRQEEGRVKVDTLEIIGHTDGVPISNKGNLDKKLPAVLAGDSEALKDLIAGSNNDLGLLRALAVKQKWIEYSKSHAQSHILSRIAIRCYSAGQTILPIPKADPVPFDYLLKDPRARRIEMRLTRLGVESPGEDSE